MVKVFSNYKKSTNFTQGRNNKKFFGDLENVDFQVIKRHISFIIMYAKMFSYI